MTVVDIRRYAAELPDAALFGALERFHNEVLPRDRPKDGIVKAADDSDMWTGDVVTGGANGYLMRAMISEYLIARDAGRTPEQAVGDGYDAAFKSYTHAVNPPPPQPPVTVTFSGPISVAGDGFQVPS